MLTLMGAHHPFNKLEYLRRNRDLTYSDLLTGVLDNVTVCVISESRRRHHVSHLCGRSKVQDTLSGRNENWTPRRGNECHLEPFRIREFHN